MVITIFTITASCHANRTSGGQVYLYSLWWSKTPIRKKAFESEKSKSGLWGAKPHHHQAGHCPYLAPLQPGLRHRLPTFLFPTRNLFFSCNVSLLLCPVPIPRRNRSLAGFGGWWTWERGQRGRETQGKPIWANRGTFGKVRGLPVNLSPVFFPHCFFIHYYFY